LIELYGDEALLRRRVEELKASEPEGADEIFQLAEKYLTGWRPRPFDRE
jgi:hypothetical protein